MAFTNVQDLQKEIATRQQYGIPVNDLQSQLKSMYANAFNNYKYAQGSAQGPATLQQASTANQTGGVNIAPAIPNPNQTPNPAGQNAGANQEGIVKPKTQAEIEAEAQAKAKKEYDDRIEAQKAEMERLKQLRIQNQIAGLRSRYGEVESEVKAKKAELDPTYEAKKLQAQSASALQAKNFAEFLANRGLSRSGTSQQAELMRNLGLQQTFNQYDAQKKADSDYYARQLDSAQSALNRDISMAQNEAEANFLDNFMKYKSDQDVAFRTEQIRREEAAREEEWKKKQYDIQKQQADRQKQTDAENAFVRSITGLGDQFQYITEIQKLENDGDPSNDWKINLLKQERQKKIDANLQKEIGTINQYYDNFQAEIDRRRKTPDTMDDALIPFLIAEQTKKKANIKATQESTASTMKKNAMDIFEKTGYATEEIAKALGIPIGTTTPEYERMKYEIRKPYYNPNTGNNKFDSNRLGTFDDYNQNIRASFVTQARDEYGQPTGRTVIDKQGIINFVNNLMVNGVDTNIVYSLMNAWGLNENDFRKFKEEEDIIARENDKALR